MRKNYYNNNLIMINIRELHYAMNSSSNIKERKALSELIDLINNYTSMSIMDFRITIPIEAPNKKAQDILRAMNGNFFNPQEFISETDYELASEYVDKYLNPDLHFYFNRLKNDNMTGLKKDIIHCCKDSIKIGEVVDYILTIKQTRGNLNKDRAVYLYDGEGIILVNAQDKDLIGVVPPYDKLTRIYLNEAGSAIAYFDINGTLFDTENISFLHKKGNEEIYPSEVIGENAEFLKNYLDERYDYDDSQLLDYINKDKEKVKEYKLK